MNSPEVERALAAPGFEEWLAGTSDPSRPDKALFSLISAEAEEGAIKSAMALLRQLEGKEGIKSEFVDLAGRLIGGEPLNVFDSLNFFDPDRMYFSMCLNAIRTMLARECPPKTVAISLKQPIEEIGFERSFECVRRALAQSA